MSEFSFIDPAMLENEKKVMDFESDLKNLGEDDQIKVFRLDGENGRQYVGKVFIYDFQNDDVYDLIKKKFGAGVFLVQSYVKGRLGGGTKISIAGEVKKEVNNNDIDSKLRDFENRILTVISSQKKDEDSEMKFLEKAKMYKEAFGGGNQNGSMKEMVDFWREGLELGKNISNPEPSQDNGMMSSIIQMLPLLLQPKGQAQNIVPIQQAKQEVKQEPRKVNPAEEEMRIQYLALINKLKKTAVLKDDSDKEQKCDTLANEIIDFFPELVQYIEVTTDEESLVTLLSQYGIKLNDEEKKIVLNISKKIKDTLSDENDPNPQ